MTDTRTEHTPEVVEAVARAIAASAWTEDASEYPDDSAEEYAENFWKAWQPQACAALASLPAASEGEKEYSPCDTGECMCHGSELCDRSSPAPSDQSKLVGWQAIETAPRDGTHFLACLTVRHMSGAQWEETHLIWANDETGTIDVECERGWEISDYEFWMPVPASPITRARQIGGGK